MCGGTLPDHPELNPGQGLSPRVRGNRVAVRLPCVRLRSIPACAGEPGRKILCGRLCRVYPRVCGGTHPQRHEPGAGYGLSPRVRGNLVELAV